MQDRPLLFALLLALVLLVIIPAASKAQDIATPMATSEVSVPRLIHLSGSVPNPEASRKVVGMTFALYREQDGGSPLWLETQNVSVDEAGRYSALLGAEAKGGLPGNLFSTNEARWLGVTLEAQYELQRILLVSVPYALKASDAETLNGFSASQLLTMAQPILAANAAGPDSSITLGRPGRTGRPADSAPSAPGPRGSFFYDGSHLVVEAYDDAAHQPLQLLLNPQGGNIGIGVANPAHSLSVAGMIESTSGGYKFPDGSSLATGVLVSSFNGRSGAIVPIPGDYSFAHLSGTVTLSQLPDSVLMNTGSFADPAWLTSLSGSKITGAVANATSASNATNAATVTNGVYTTGSYANPVWLTSLGASKISGAVAEAVHATNADAAATAGSSVTASSLNGIAGANYARRDVANGFTGDQTLAGKLGVGVSSPAEAVEVAGNVKLTGAVKFGDGTSVQSASGMVPAGFTIMGSSATPPAGYTAAGWSTVMNPLAWSRKSKMPGEQACGAFGVANGKLYIISGFSDIDLVPGLKVQEYDPAADVWTSKNPAPTARSCPTGGVVNNKIYVFGGFIAGGNPLATVEEYTPATDSWVTKAPMPVALAFASAAVVGSKVYIFGGDTSGQCCSPTNAVREYDTTTNTWRSMDPMPVSLRARSAATLGGKVYLFGGTMPYTNETDQFDPAAAPGSQWTVKTPRPNTCEASPTVVYNTMIFLFACWNSPVATGVVDVYIPANDTWVSAPPVPRGASAYDAGLINGQIYLAAGGTNTEIYTETYQLDPAKVILYLYTKN